MKKQSTQARFNTGNTKPVESLELAYNLGRIATHEDPETADMTARERRQLAGIQCAVANIPTGPRRQWLTDNGFEYVITDGKFPAMIGLIVDKEGAPHEYVQDHRPRRIKPSEAVELFDRINSRQPHTSSLDRQEDDRGTALWLRWMANEAEKASNSGGTTKQKPAEIPPKSSMKTVYEFARIHDKPNALMIDKAGCLWLACLHFFEPKKFKVCRQISVKESVDWYRKSESKFKEASGTIGGQAAWFKLVAASIMDKAA